MSDDPMWFIEKFFRFGKVRFVPDVPSKPVPKPSKSGLYDLASPNVCEVTLDEERRWQINQLLVS